MKQNSGKLKTKKKTKRAGVKVRANRKARKKHVSCGTCEHNPFTHFPKDPSCDICNHCKIQRAPLKIKPEAHSEALPTPVKFADSITLDHKVLEAQDAGAGGERAACIIQDIATYWLQGYEAPDKSSDSTREAVAEYLGPQCKAQYVYSDNSPEIRKALTDLGYNPDTSTPHRPSTNGVIEKAVGRVSEGTSCSLFQSGFADPWWPKAMRTYCFHRNAVDRLVNGHTAWFNRFGTECEAKIIPLGAEVYYYPISKKDKMKLHRLNAKTLRGIFVGYEQRKGGGFSGDFSGSFSGSFSLSHERKKAE